MALTEPMPLDIMISRSICSIDNSETRKRLASNLVLAGGVVKTPHFFEWLEDCVFLRIRDPVAFDESITCVEV